MPEAMLHIASAVVKARPSDQDAVAAGIAALPSAEVAALDSGRIIVVLEANDQTVISETLAIISNIDGVLSATLVFEHSEGVPA